MQKPLYIYIFDYTVCKHEYDWRAKISMNNGSNFGVFGASGYCMLKISVNILLNIFFRRNQVIRVYNDTRVSK